LETAAKICRRRRFVSQIKPLVTAIRTLVTFCKLDCPGCV